MKHFNEVDSKKSVDASEKEILEFWEREEIFKKSLKLRETAEAYSFYDGPPFATGTPHYGHLEQSLLKDVVPRYWTMRGKYVERRWGWDCHGLPIENIVEKEMGSKSKKDIEAMGIEEFNKRCRSNIKGYVGEWKRVISRFGRWADMEDAYWTMDPEYMESVWAVFADLWKKDLIYEGYRSMHMCPRCETTLSQSEVAEGYKDVKDLSVVVKFQITNDQRPTTNDGEIPNPKFQISGPNADSKPTTYNPQPTTYILAWTTTPWTLMGNVALAVGEDIEYVIIEKQDEGVGPLIRFILAQELLEKHFGVEGYVKVKVIQGKDLIGLSYKPIFEEYARDEKLENRERGWKIYGADFVTTEDGTGVVHIAPAFGTDDMNLGKAERLPFVQHIGTDGIFRKETGALAGLDVKPRAKDKPDEVREGDIAILKKLKEIGAYFSHEKYLHSYPHCWRCDTALLNYATSSWFVAVEKIKERALTQAKEIDWVPAHVKDGRFGKWLEGARDWSISRQRFWASVLPIWKCEECAKTRVVGDVMEISEELGGVNRLYLVRHGEAKSNLNHIWDSQGDPENHLTDLGKKNVWEIAQKELKNKKIDIIISSPLLRTRETADIIGEELATNVVQDDRIQEIRCGAFEGKSATNLPPMYQVLFEKERNDVTQGVETFEELSIRLLDFVRDINERYQGKNILIVSHADPLFALHGLLKKMSEEEMKMGWFPKNGEIRSIFSKTVDLHRPYIDEVKLKCECGGVMTRVPDVLDTWFDSGSMPYAQMHYPFENEAKFKSVFPADFIGEMVEQTRSWFYYMHILGVATQGTNAFKNVVADGTILAEDGKKMSKKLKNYPDPSIMIEKYGSDALRMYLLSSPLFTAENLNFSERELGELSRGMFRMLRNTYSFFVMYANVDGWHPTYNLQPTTYNLLDRWIVSELNVLTKNVNEAMEKYELAKATRLFAPFVDDLSNWYVRRSRRRFWKSESDSDKQSAYETLYAVLLELSKLLAPFAPFVADEIYRNLTNDQRPTTNNGEEKIGESSATRFPLFATAKGVASPRVGGVGVTPESVHLCDFPQADESMIDEKLMKEMRSVREIVTQGLELRSSAKVKVRQPLSRLQVIGDRLQEMMEEIIQEELNVKEVVYGKKMFLDTEITPELKLEGQAREVVRAVQELRKKTGYNVDDRIILGYDGMNEVFEKFGESIIAKETLAVEVRGGKLEGADAEQEISIDGERLTITIKK